MASEMWERFYASAFPRNWTEAKDGLDAQAVLALGEGERLKAEAVLLAEVMRGDSPRVIQALGLLGSRASVARLEALLERGAPDVQVAAAEALWRITRRPDAVVQIESALARMRGPLAESDRLQVPHALASIGTREALKVLARLLDQEDEDSLLFWNTALALAELRAPGGGAYEAMQLDAASLAERGRAWLRAQGIAQERPR